MDNQKPVFLFDEKKHVYTLDGKKLTGVTTILGTIAKPALIAWAAKEAVKYVRENATKDDDLFLVTEEILRAAEKAHAKKRDKAADAGTDVHAECEAWIKTKVIPLAPSPSFLQFKEWAEGNVGEFLESEKRLYHEGEWYAGTVDLVYKDPDGRVWVADIKTTSGIYDRTPFFQMAGYQNAIEYMGEFTEPIHGRKIIRMGKDGSFETKDSLSYEDDLGGFLAALQLYRALQTFKV